MRGIESGRGYLLRVERSASLLDAIAEFADRHGIAAAALSGIGAVSDVELGYFHAERQVYDQRTLEGEYELISLTGNISLRDEKPFVHAHALLGTPDLTCLGGHLFAAIVTVTAEIHLVPLDRRVDRAHDAETGIALLDMPEI